MPMPEHTIAVVEDDAGLRKSLGRLLSAFGYRVEAFASAEEFLSAAPTSTATCLIVDFNLGDVSGLELARRLSAAGFEFPIIFMTGAADDTVQMQCMEFGCVAFLNKPFLQDQLMQAIRKATPAVRRDGGAQHRMTGLGLGCVKTPSKPSAA
jgi:FixJ family two-component response regulator